MLNCRPRLARQARDVFSRQAVTFDAVAGIYAPAAVFSRSTSFFGPLIIGRHFGLGLGGE
jgi:hypothetical protein